MTAKDMKIKTFSLIEEYYPDAAGMAEDEDVLFKINGVINEIQMDLMKYRPIEAYKTISVDEETDKTIEFKDELPNLYQINRIILKPALSETSREYNMVNGTRMVIDDDFVGDIYVYYTKTPNLMQLEFETDEEKDAYDETYEFEIDPVLLEIMPYGVAADLLKMDMISSYGKYFYERYLEMKQSIDPRYTKGIISIVGGIDI